MRAVRFHEHGGPDVLQVDEVEDPEPGHGEVRVAVEAAGVNPVDTYFRAGSYPVPELPWVTGSDVAGVVDAVGPGVDDCEGGDRVFATGLGRDRPGTYAQRVTVPTDRLATLPHGVSFEEGAAVALVGVTAWQAFVHHAGLEPAETVLVQGGNGGVGHVAVQLARAMGATVVTTARPEYEDHLRSLGARRVVDYRQDDDALAAAVTARGAPDVILETLMDRRFPFDAQVAADGARIVGIGNEDSEAPIPVGPGKSKDLRFQLMSMFNTGDTAAILSRLARLMVEGDLAPDVAGTFPLEAAGEAQRRVVEESQQGKLVVVPE